jgi:hypothetical protein
VPTVEPRELRYVVWLPSVVAVPVVEPRESRNVTVLPLLVAVPMVEPRESRRTVWFWAAAGIAKAMRVAVAINKRFIVGSFQVQQAPDGRLAGSTVPSACRA